MTNLENEIPILIANSAPAKNIPIIIKKIKLQVYEILCRKHITNPKMKLINIDETNLDCDNYNFIDVNYNSQVFFNLEYEEETYSIDFSLDVLPVNHDCPFESTIDFYGYVGVNGSTYYSYKIYNCVQKTNKEIKTCNENIKEEIKIAIQQCFNFMKDTGFNQFDFYLECVKKFEKESE